MPALAPREDGALLVARVGPGGALRALALDRDGAPVGQVQEVLPRETEGPRGGVALVSRPGGFVLAWLEAHLTLDQSPTHLFVAFVDAEGRLRGEAPSELGPMAFTPGAAAVIGTEEGAIVAAIVDASRARLARIARVPLSSVAPPRR